MTLHFQVRGMKHDAVLQRQVESDLESLNGLFEVSTAQVALHCQPEVMPPCQAVAMLEGPGPEIHAAARDHTLLAAWQKAMARLREQIEERRARPESSRSPQAGPSGSRSRRPKEL